MKTGTFRLKTSSATPAQLRRLSAAMQSPSILQLKAKDGAPIALPEGFRKALRFAVRQLAEGREVVVASEDALCTSQDAADYLGMSRQHFVTLLEEGQLPYHRNGTHRRVRLSAVKAFAKRRDKERRRRLGGLFKGLKKDGLYH